METNKTPLDLPEYDEARELIGLLTAISNVSKRLANKIRLLESAEQGGDFRNYGKN